MSPSRCPECGGPMAAGGAGKHVQVAPHIPEAESVEETTAPEPVRTPRAGRLMCVACGTVVEAASV